MGALFSRWRRKPSTLQVLEELEKEIKRIEAVKQSNLEKQRRVLGYLLLYSALLYILCALVLYLYYLPDEWLHRLACSLPMLIFPVIIYLLRKVLHWYFVKRIARNETSLEELRERKKKILEEVMEKETYKKAKEILDRFDPDSSKLSESALKTPAPMRAPDGQDLRKRGGPVPATPAMTPQVPSTVKKVNLPTATPAVPRSTAQSVQPVVPQSAQRNGQHVLLGGTPVRPAPGPPMSRPILPRERTLADRMIEFLVGDGPQNRYALICHQCKSHNGMALKEEFEFLSFRCCYCYTFNSAKKQRPFAPKLEKASPVAKRLDLNQTISDANPPDLKAESSESHTEKKENSEENEPEPVETTS